MKHAKENRPAVRIPRIERRAGVFAAREWLSSEKAIETIALLFALLPDDVACEICSRVPDFALPAEGFDLEAHLDAARGCLMQEALNRCGGEQTRAAKLLRISFRSFRYYRKKYGLTHRAEQKEPGPTPAAEK